MSWHKGGEPSEPGEYVVVMGRSKFLMTYRDGRWFDGYIRRDPQWVEAHFKVPLYRRADRGEQ